MEVPVATLLAFEGKQPSPSDNILRKVPRRPKNNEVHTREYLTPDEVERLMHGAGRVGRHPFRDKTLILIAYRHALRVSEVVSLRWDQVDLKQGQLHVVRVKDEGRDRLDTPAQGA